MILLVPLAGILALVVVGGLTCSHVLVAMVAVADAVVIILEHLLIPQVVVCMYVRE